MFGRQDRQDRPPRGGRFTGEQEHGAGDGATTTMARDEERAGHRDPAARDGAPRGVVAGEQMRAIRARQRAEFGGIAWGSAFFGWLVAFGVAALLSGLLAALGAATGLAETASGETVGLVGGIALLVAAGVAYFCGGYVAGRLARFDGARNGLAVWLVGLILTVALGALAYLGGEEYNLMREAELPRLTVGEEAATTGGLIAMAAILLVTALAAVAGGKTGERFHGKVDRHVTR